MKQMLEVLVDFGVSEPKVRGLLVVGYICNSFMMDLSYDGLYRMVQLNEFKLMRNPHDITLIPRIVESLCQANSIITTTASNIRTRIINDNNDDTSSRIYASFKRSSCDIPEKTEKNNNLDLV